MVLFPVVLVILMVCVIDYYVESVSVTHMDVAWSGRVGTMSILTSALLLSFLWNHPFVAGLTTLQHSQDVISPDHILSGGVVFSFVLFMFGESYFRSVKLKFTMRFKYVMNRSQ